MTQKVIIECMACHKRFDSLSDPGTVDNCYPVGELRQLKHILTSWVVDDSGAKVREPTLEEYVTMKVKDVPQAGVS